MLTLDKVFHASVVLKDIVRKTTVVSAPGIAPDGKSAHQRKCVVKVKVD